LDFARYFSKDVIAFVSDRSIDFAIVKQKYRLNAAQRKFFKEKTGVCHDNFPVIRQVHGKRILVVKRPSCLTSFLGKADGFITKRSSIPLTVRTADCLSIFMFDPKQKAISLIHAGWKGSKKGIAKAAVRLMKKEYKTDPRDLKIVFGPAIQKCCYQVGPEFKKYFPKEVFRKGRNYFLDLPLANQRQLVGMGVKGKNIVDCGLCTYCNPKLFSYRREGEKAGRMASVIMLKAESRRRDPFC